MTNDAGTPMKKPWYHLSLTKQILLGLVFGILLGWLRPEWATETAFLRNIFISLIKSIIAPLIFSSIVAGIAGSSEEVRGVKRF